MFTGFASENTPAIQVWDFSNTASSTTSSRFVSLSDDCAPIQYFKTGQSTAKILLYLPTAPIEGKVITIVNSRFGFSTQMLSIYSSDKNRDGTNDAVYGDVGQGQTLRLIYSKEFLKSQISAGSEAAATGWVSLDMGASSGTNYWCVVVGGSGNTAATSNGGRAAVLGGGLNSATNGYAAVVGGGSNTASGLYSAVAGGISNTSSGGYSVVVGGDGNTSSGTYSSVVGGVSNNAASSSSAILGGQSNNTSSASNSVILGGTNNSTNAVSSSILGGSRGITRSIIGNAVLPASNAPISTTAGGSQSALLVLGVQTTDATATVLRSDTSAASGTNQVTLPNNSAYYFRGEVIAGVTGAGDTKGWYIEGVIKRGANAASTAIVGAATVTSLYADAGAATWAVTATANTTLGCLKIEVTGAAATTIRWVCQIRTTEMTF